jgi:hypothetical protein
MLLTYGIHTLADVIIANPTQTNLVLHVISYLGVATMMVHKQMKILSQFTPSGCIFFALP